MSVYDNTIHIKNKRKDKRIDRKIAVLRQVPKINKTYHHRRIRLPASATIEAYLVIPIYIYAIMVIAYVIQMIGIKSCVEQALYSDARTLAGYAYACDTNLEDYKEVLNTMALYTLVDNLGTQFAADNYIVNGTLGLSMTDSNILDQDNDIELVVTYRIKIPFDIFGIGGIWVTQGCTTQAWLGTMNETDDTDADDESTDTVYITATGEVYHTYRDCVYLNPSVHSIHYEEINSSRNNSGGKYTLCELCAKGSGDLTAQSTVYITNYGDKYHTKSDCSGLKRIILEVSRSEVSGWRLCSKCSGR